ncbi:hypothetical protein BGZ96_002732 [Linnemannia gamsii]|uniref:Extracellular membrane protein CFEM domain-containing protein n=1 Tax=Linnemannia gamsii TaxID=64522 RepID=A0ABQ7JK72_9FUNG|nr:hypothetical protein BGZ96_002732 [Linnemannia gamsii]
MKLIVTLLATIAAVNAYTCPSPSSINSACRDISVTPLICSNPIVNVDPCNEKQCNQPYIDNYAACQCRRSATLFYEHSVNVEGLIRRCGIEGLTNPFGNPLQYRPGQGTQTFSAPSGTSTNGTRGTTAPTSAAPIEAPSPTTIDDISEVNYHMSGGAIAGTVLGSLAAVALACLLGWCWRKKRAQHATLYGSSSAAAIDPNVAAHSPTRTVVTEKIEPVVVKSVPTNNTHVVGSGTTNYSTSADNYNNANYNTPTNTYSSTSNPTSSTYNNTSYNTNPTTSSGYNTHPRTGSGGAINAVNNDVHSGVNTTSNTVGHGGVSTTGNTVGTGVNATGITVGSGINAVGNEVRGASNSASNAMH